MPARSATRDKLFGGTLSLLQPSTGYRVNVDALLLAAFAANGRVARRVVDLGAGTGVIGLSLVHVGSARELVLVERERGLVGLARRNVAHLGPLASVLSLDLERDGLPRMFAQTADSGRVQPAVLRARARAPTTERAVSARPQRPAPAVRRGGGTSAHRAAWSGVFRPPGVDTRRAVRCSGARSSRAETAPVRSRDG